MNKRIWGFLVIVGLLVFSTKGNAKAEENASQTQAGVSSSPQSTAWDWTPLTPVLQAKCFGKYWENSPAGKKNYRDCMAGRISNAIPSPLKATPTEYAQMQCGGMTPRECNLDYNSSDQRNMLRDSDPKMPLPDTSPTAPLDVNGSKYAR